MERTLEQQRKPSAFAEVGVVGRTSAEAEGLRWGGRSWMVEHSHRRQRATIGEAASSYFCSELLSCGPPGAHWPASHTTGEARRYVRGGGKPQP
jgi:hypothetical protein